VSFRELVASLGAGLLLVATTLPTIAQPEAVETPQAATVKICSGCHTMQLVTDTPRDLDAWHDTVQSMIDRGARGTADEFDLVMQFLFENVTTVDVNHADQETLETVLHTKSATADAIIARRSIKPFKDLSEMEDVVPGLDRQLLESKKRMIFFQ
jgi:DNA uptake protein ComE-like DNA-binding protein